MSNKTMNYTLLALAVVAVGAIGYGVATMPDDRTAGEHIGDAIDSLDQGVDDAARELEDRTPLERASDEVEDATN